MKIQTEKTYWARIYMAGEIETAKQVCREQAMLNPPGDPGNCVTIEPTAFIFTGGEEAGFVVGLINYPRFPVKPKAVFDRAVKLAGLLIERTCQHSALVMAPDKTVWTTRRKDK